MMSIGRLKLTKLRWHAEVDMDLIVILLMILDAMIVFHKKIVAFFIKKKLGSSKESLYIVLDPLQLLDAPKWLFLFIHHHLKDSCIIFVFIECSPYLGIGLLS